jgi:hypothetical protein
VKDGRYLLSPRAVKAFALLVEKPTQTQEERVRPGAARADDRSEAEKRRDARAAAKAKPKKRR